MWSTIAAWVNSSWTKLLPWIIGVSGVLGGLAMVKQSGVNAQIAKDAQNELKFTKEALQTTQSISALDDTAVSAKLRKYYRD